MKRRKEEKQIFKFSLVLYVAIIKSSIIKINYSFCIMYLPLVKNFSKNYFRLFIFFTPQSDFSGQKMILRLHFLGAYLPFPLKINTKSWFWGVRGDRPPKTKHQNHFLTWIIWFRGQKYEKPKIIFWKIFDKGVNHLFVNSTNRTSTV